MDFEPKWIAWEITRRCNLKCVHCRSSSELDIEGHPDFSFDEAKAIIDDIATYASPVLVLSGGEPLLRKDVFDIAVRNIELNNLTNQISILHTDIKGLHRQFENSEFDLITCNPPFFKYKESSHINKNEYKTIARHEVLITLEDIIIESKRLLTTKGSLVMVHRTERLVDIINTLTKHRFQVKRLRFVYPKKGVESNMVLIEASNNGQPGLKLMEPLYVHEDDYYTDEVLKIFNYGKE